MKLNRKLPLKRTTLVIIGTVLLWCTVALWNEFGHRQAPPADKPGSTTVIPSPEATEQAHAAR